MGIRASGAFFDVDGALYQVARSTLNVAADLSINRSGVSIKEAALFYVAAALKNILASTLNVDGATFNVWRSICFVGGDSFDVEVTCKDSRDAASIVALALPYRRSRSPLCGGGGVFDSATGHFLSPASVPGACPRSPDPCRCSAAYSSHISARAGNWHCFVREPGHAPFQRIDMRRP